MSVNNDNQQGSSGDLDSAVQLAKKEILRVGKQRLPRLRSERSGFERRLQRLYERPFELFDAIFLPLEEIGRSYYSEQGLSAAQEHDYMFAVQGLLHARACLTTSEVRALLATGHATGAFTRWRTLYELVVISNFITKDGAEAAERFYHHDLIQVYELMQLPQNVVDPSKFEQTRIELIAKYGQEISTLYGWASPWIINRKTGKPTEKPTFSRLEQEAGIPQLRGWYQHSSNVTHATQLGNRFNVQNPYPDTMIVAGASMAGLSDPAWLTLRSLLHITNLFVQTRTLLQTPFVMRALDQLIMEMATLFQTIEEEMKAKNPKGLHWK
jgi:hypothetical protein